MKKIDQLKKQPSRDPKVYYTQLVDIFREYLEKRKNIHSFSQTTEDLSRQLKQLSMPEARYREMVTTLSLSDMVKFARYLPAEEENAYSTETIKQSIVAIENLK